MDHSTGKGWVKEHKGHYHDALMVKGSRVVPWIVETFGGQAPHSLAYLRHLSRRARGKSARDATKYGTSNTSPRSFYEHHRQRVSAAAILGDAAAIVRSVNARKQDHAAGVFATGAA